jgi:NADPH-dependent glutamate synthase beta subunit-like oxidoreductase/NAD(P)H-flavin reductase
MLEIQDGVINSDPAAEMRLGIDGFVYADLYRPDRLRDLAEAFYAELAELDQGLHAALMDYVGRRGEGYADKQESELLVLAAPYLSRFLARLFQVEDERERQIAEVQAQDPIWIFRTFITRRATKKFPAAVAGKFDLAALDQAVDRFRRSFFPENLIADDELGIARTAARLLEAEKQFERPDGEPSESVTVVTTALTGADTELRGWLATCGVPDEERKGEGVAGDSNGLHSGLRLFEAWAAAHAEQPAGRERVKHWLSFKTVHALDYQNLVHLERPRTDLPELIQGLDKNLRRRDGFGLTDNRATKREVLYEVDYCLYCHERDKDSCSAGFKEKDGSWKRNPLGIKLEGCPLDEKISEMHLVKRQGDSIGALALVMIDNPMCPGTGHRICNDCMKACIFQKQDPVNIPQAETGVLTDVLEMPWGFEIYGLLTRWNPLNAKRPFALPYNGKNVLVVGLGPAGYTLAHYLLNEGFGVIGVDGLKIEPLEEAMTGTRTETPRPVKNIAEIEAPLDQRILSGFGGVSEYGITVRWDKNFLTMIHLTLARRDRFRFYGGIRFGGTLTIEDAWELGFDHIAVATGAGKPTVVEMKNNLMRGIRKASDFLMALQLTGAFKKDAMANLQVRLPAIVIGGGLTAIDTATELFAYYPVQVEKMLDRHADMAAAFGEEKVWAMFGAEEQAIYAEFLEHGRAIKEERARAAAAGEEPNFVPLVRGWGSVSIVYRKRLQDSPAYRLNHEEVHKSLEEGISYVENMSPTEAVPDEFGALKELVFERQHQDPATGKWSNTGEFVAFPARTCCVAAGTSPNIIYEKEVPGTFKLDEWNYFFSPHRVEPDESGNLRTVPAAKGERGFFTSYQKDGRFISYYGDNHPIYAGNVVKAMASARDGYEEVVKLFGNELASLDPHEQDQRDAVFAKLTDYLDEQLLVTVVRVDRLTPTIVDVIVKAPMQARKFHPGQFYRLQNFESIAAKIGDTRMTMEGIALTGAWVDRDMGLLSLIVLEMGTSSRLCATLKPGEPVVVMGPTGTPTEIPENETVVLLGGGLGNAVLFSIAKAMRQRNNQVIYFAGYKKGEDLYKREEIEDATDQVIWSTDTGAAIEPARPQDRHFRGNIVQAMVAYANGELGEPLHSMKVAHRLIAIGSDRMMAAVKAARHGILAPYLRPDHIGIGSINSPMQCMMKEVCAQCLQKHVDPVTGKESFVFSCFNQDQLLDQVDFQNLNDRLRANSVQEKLSNLWLDRLLQESNNMLV